ncbi:hypothetical protein HDV05_004812 [Chytridiales sp. JEL 0842]|nr:hypothetical protein HDV05_004812 [Chytridiales sp. JEL 0842]
MNSTLNIPSTLPAASAWTVPYTGFAQVIDKASNLYWDSVLPYQGAQVQLMRCNALAPTQMFQTASLGNYQTILGVEGMDGAKLCVELSTGGILKLQTCKNGYTYQVFTINGHATTTGGNTAETQACVAPSVPQAFSTITYQQTCTTTASISTLQPLTDPSKAPQKYLSTLPIKPHPLTIDGLCVDSANHTVNLAANPCVDNLSSQQWFHLFGQIRNVETGLCLDAPGVEGWNPSATAWKLSLTPCTQESSTMMWIKTLDNVLVNGESSNCVRLVKDGNTASVVLGTEFCSDKDILASNPKTFTSIDSFTWTLDKPTTCTTNVIRKDIRDLTSQEQATFFSALNKLHTIPSFLGRRHFYDDIVALHGLVAPYIRFTDKAGVLTPTLLGTSGYNKENQCVTDGFMAGTWIPNDGNPCLIRAYDPQTKGNTSVVLYSEPFMLLSVKENPEQRTAFGDYNSYREFLESTAHNNFHMAIAGDSDQAQMGDPARSVADPAFFHHHGNVDRYWWYFQKGNVANPSLAEGYNGQAQVPPYGSRTVDVKPTDMLPGFNVPVSEGLTYASGIFQCVKYKSYSNSVASVYSQQSVLEGLSKRKRRAAEPKTAIDVIVGADPNHSVAPNTPKVSLENPTPLTNKFMQSRKWMKMDPARIRAIEQAATAQNERLKAATAAFLGREFAVGYEQATFEQFAIATKHAIAQLTTH